MVAHHSAWWWCWHLQNSDEALVSDVPRPVSPLSPHLTTPTHSLSPVIFMATNTVNIVNTASTSKEATAIKIIIIIMIFTAHSSFLKHDKLVNKCFSLLKS